jgi:protein TonB
MAAGDDGRAGAGPTPDAAPITLPQHPTIISSIEPIYPKKSRKKGEEGVVWLKVLIGTDGLVADASVDRGSGFARLDDAALTAVRSWRWQPMTMQGEPEMVRGLVDIHFAITPDKAREPERPPAPQAD